MEEDTNSRVAGQAAVPCYIRLGYTGAFLACLKLAREDGSPGWLQGSERPPLIPPFKPISSEPEMTIACISEPSPPGHLEDGISLSLKASITLPLSGSKVMNQVRHFVLLIFFFLIRGMIGYGGNPRDEIFHFGPRNVLSPGRPLLSLQCLRGRMGALSC